jgi:hypothetical protein
LYESLFTTCYVCNTFIAQITPWARELILERLDTQSAFGWDGADLGKGDRTPLVTGVELLPHEFHNMNGSEEPRNYVFTVYLQEEVLLGLSSYDETEESILPAEEDPTRAGITIRDRQARDVEVRFVLDCELHIIY